VPLHRYVCFTEPESSNADKADEDGEAVPADKPYNDLRVIRKALTAYTSTSQMEDAWGHDPRWQVCPAGALSPACIACCLFVVAL